MESYILSSGIEIVNTTPHALTFSVIGSNATESVPPSGILLNAAVAETSTIEGGVTFTTPTFQASDAALQTIAELNQQFPNALIIGSLIAAQAYPGKVVAMVASPGYERVPPAEKRMDPTKFTRYSATK